MLTKIYNKVFWDGNIFEYYYKIQLFKINIQEIILSIMNLLFESMKLWTKSKLGRNYYSFYLVIYQ